MNVKNEEGVTAEVAKALRREAKLPQWKFWAAVGVNQASGCRYENDKLERIPRSVRILLFAIYVVGLDIDATTEEGVARLFRLAQVRKSASSAENTVVLHHPV